MKKEYLLEPTKMTPYVLVNYNKGVIYIKGRSSPENTLEFYEQVFEAIAAFEFEEQETITANLEYLYFNTSSARCIYLILSELTKLKDLGKKVIVNWFAEENDEDMVETGQDFQDIVDLEFNIRKTTKAQNIDE